MDALTQFIVGSYTTFIANPTVEFFIQTAQQQHNYPIFLEIKQSNNLYDDIFKWEEGCGPMPDIFLIGEKRLLISIFDISHSAELSYNRAISNKLRFLAAIRAVKREPISSSSYYKYSSCPHCVNIVSNTITNFNKVKPLFINPHYNQIKIYELYDDFVKQQLTLIKNHPLLIFNNDRYLPCSQLDLGLIFKNLPYDLPKILQIYAMQFFIINIFQPNINTSIEFMSIKNLKRFESISKSLPF